MSRIIEVRCRKNDHHVAHSGCFVHRIVTVQFVLSVLGVVLRDVDLLAAVVSAVGLRRRRDGSRCCELLL